MDEGHEEEDEDADDGDVDDEDMDDDDDDADEESKSHSSSESTHESPCSTCFALIGTVAIVPAGPSGVSQRMGNMVSLGNFQ